MYVQSKILKGFRSKLKKNMVNCVYRTFFSVLLMILKEQEKLQNTADTCKPSSTVYIGCKRPIKCPANTHHIF